MKSRFTKTESIVLNSKRFGEGHNIINLFTESLGKIDASAFGVRKTKSRFGSKLEPFTISRMLLYRKSDESLFTVRDVEVISYNTTIREDLGKFIVGNSIIEPVIRFVETGEIDKRLFQLLSNSLKVLNEIVTKKAIHLLSMYDLQFLSIMGYGQETSTCVKCGNNLNSNDVYMDLYYGFPLCKICRTKSSTRVYKATLRFVDWAQCNTVIDAKKVTMNDNTLANIRNLIENIYMFVYHKKLESWKQMTLLKL